MLSRNLEKTLHRALAYANERRHEYATLEHLLLALTEDQDAIAVLRACTVDLEKLRRDLIDYVDNELGNLVSTHAEDAKPTAGFQRVLQRAAIHVQSSGREEVTGANVLVAHVRRAREPRRLFPARAGHDALRRRQLHLARHRQGAGPLRDAPRPGRRRGGAQPRRQQKRGHDALDAYCVNLNKKARNGKIDPLIGREPEVERTIQILCRRTKNNPLYVGDPGVGKTAIAEGLARRIVAARSARGAAERHHLSRSTWARCWPARAIAAISRSGSRRCSPSSRRCPARSCSSTRSTP